MIDKPDCEIEPLVRRLKGPDFPTGGIIIDSFSNILQNYIQGKGYFRIRAKWQKEDLGHGQYQIVVTEIPYGVIKSKLIERIAQLLNDKKVPMLNDVRDEAAQDVRIVLEPKNRCQYADGTSVSADRIGSSFQYEYERFGFRRRASRNVD